MNPNGLIPNFIPLDKYIPISGKLYPLVKAQGTGVIYFKHNGSIVWYDEQRDGTPLDLVQAKQEYPEMFI